MNFPCLSFSLVAKLTSNCGFSRQACLFDRLQGYLNEMFLLYRTLLLGQQTEARSIGSIIRRRTCDEKVGVRKAALQVGYYTNGVCNCYLLWEII